MKDVGLKTVKSMKKGQRIDTTSGEALDPKIHPMRKALGVNWVGTMS